MDSEDFIQIISKYSNKCINCGEVIEEGEEVLWKKGVGVKHKECIAFAFFKENRPVNLEEWKDSAQYTLLDLEKKTHCQRCGIETPSKSEIYIYESRRVCEDCF